jgi:hypothetical protein
MINAELLLNEIKEYYSKHNKIPRSCTKLTDGIHPTIMFRRYFGSWNSAITLAGFNPYIQPKPVDCICNHCGKTFKYFESRLKNKNRKSGRMFCSKSCAATYNNTHKTHGYRRSKLEAYIETKLITNYPNLEIHFNRKDTINSELDIYIPSLKLAFELNGIFHYEPIYSDKQFSQIQNNDKRKFCACLEKNIELCIVDSSSLTYFKPDKAEKYYQIVKQLIDHKLSDIK